ncbi:MAG: ABC transporter permease [Desulfobacteraceae bacterium]|jgi:peptide/nickel transport system permease protein
MHKSNLIYAIKRILYAVPAIAGLLVLAFVISRMIPADPAALVAGEMATPEQVEELRHRYGFDRPLHVQLAFYFQQLLRGDLGKSLYTGRKVIQDLVYRFPATLELTIVAMLISIVAGIPLGIFAALKRNSLLDHMLRGFTVAGLAIASFWLGIMLQLLFSMWLGITPLGGRIDVSPPEFVTGMYLLDAMLTLNGTAFLSALKHILLPAITLAFSCFATITRFTRSGVLDVIQADFILYERAMGLPPRLVVYKYLLRNAVISTVTQVGLLFGLLLAGTVVIETVFDWPGLGLYAFNSIVLSDYQAILGVTLWAGIAYVTVNLIVDISLSIIDPRKTEL